MNQVSASEMNPDNASADEKQRKRVVSNRESARRSRMRKQMHLNNLTNQKTVLEISKAKLVSNINNAAAGIAAVEAENRALRMEKMRLGHHLQFSGTPPAVYTWRQPQQQLPEQPLGFAEIGEMNPWNV
ncbi:bZIP transcription factor 44-like [Malania oleifera]|uniref:bZIP transcription factor 44-like n=1 Tax=Malania oleifera TaxID=397392 RepID=UPI0025AE5276|nr:bZIP transcription factor 44-like [Malania oleifera]